MKSLSVVVTVASGLVAFAMPVVAYAQFMPVVPYAQTYTMTHLHNQLLVQPGVNAEMRRNAAARRATAQSVNPPTLQNRQQEPAKTRQAMPAMLNFTASISQRRATLREIVQEYSRINPRSASEIRTQLLDNGDFIETIGGAISEYGYRTTNLADAYSIFWITAWEASHGVTGSKTSRAQAQAVQRQVETILLTLPETSTASDSAKQSFAEVLLVQAVLIQSASEQYAVGSPTRPQFERSVRQTAAALGFDLDMFTLMPTGFELAVVSTRNTAR
jgi:hypothetical protein